MKCPLSFCNKPDSEFNGTTLYRHFQTDHTFMIVASYLSYTLEKIHGKLETLRRDYDNDNYEYTNVIEAEIGILSSILGSNK